MELETRERFGALVQMAKEFVERGIQADQIIVVETATANVYHFENHFFVDGKVDVRFPDEEQFMNMLLEKTDCEIKYIVCMWKNGSVEIPSMHFRELLMEASPKNADAMFVVLTEDGKGGLALGIRTVKQCMPAKK